MQEQPYHTNPVLRLSINPLVGIEGPQPFDFYSEPRDMRGEVGSLVQQGFPYTVCHPTSRRRSRQMVHSSAEKIATGELFRCPEYCAHVQHTAGNRNESDDCYPELIGLCLIEATIQQIGIFVNVLLVASVCPAATNHRQQVQLANNPKNRLDVHMLLLVALQPALYLSNPISLPAMFLTLSNQVDQPRVFRILSMPFPPRIVPATGYFKQLAHPFNSVFPRKRSITRYFRFNNVRLRTENFAATPLVSATAQFRCFALLLYLPALCTNVAWGVE